MSSYIRRALNRLVEYPELVLVELEDTPEVFDEADESQVHRFHGEHSSLAASSAGPFSVGTGAHTDTGSVGSYGTDR
jgi:hypothetical protein